MREKGGNLTSHRVGDESTLQNPEGLDKSVYVMTGAPRALYKGARRFL